MSEKKGLFGGLFHKRQKDSYCNMKIIEKKNPGCNVGIVKKRENNCSRTCNPITSTEGVAAFASSAANEKTVIRVVGIGCIKCNKLTENAIQAANELGINFEIIKISDITEIAATGVMQTPGLIIGDKIVSTGNVPSIEEIKRLLSKWQ